MELIATTQAVLNAPANPLPLKAHFCFSEEDSLIVQLLLVLQMETAGGLVLHDQQMWEFSRDLLDEAFSKPGEVAGLADVKITYLEEPELQVCDGIWLGQHQLKIVLFDSSERTHPIYCDAEPVVDFMAESLRRVPVGSETADVDGAIARLLDGTHGL